MTIVAWRILIHEAGRSALAIGGIFIAILMIFLQLGFYAAVPAAGVLIYDKMRFDILLTSSSYVFQAQAGEFPRRRLQQAAALPDVASVAPVYLDAIQWSVEKDQTRREVFIIGFKLGDPVFDAPDVDRQIDALRRPDTVLVDSASFPIFGPVGKGTVVEIASRTVTIGGRCEVGIGSFPTAS
jgi:putative ABC transport system permease protein